jgi:GNAT superfamily N-acetyltransferase
LDTSKLDNPVWFSLSETHRDSALEFDGVKFYKPQYCPFGGFIKMDQTAQSIAEYARDTSNFYVVGDQPKFNSPIILHQELVCNQMVLDKEISIAMDEHIVDLHVDHHDDLLNLVNLVQPGYFKNKTSELGNYYGIYKDSQLVAVTGERMKMNAYTEVSAVVTHPRYTGLGFAKKLVAHTCHQIFLQNKVPYLHVAENNSGAINLYEKLGFKTRRKISFWNLIKPA